MRELAAAGMASLLLAACAPTPMRPEVRERLVAADADRLAAFATCCHAWNDVDFSRTVGATPIELQIGAPNTQVREVDGRKAAVVGFRLPATASDYRLEFVSFGDTKRGLFRLDDRLFLRPDITYLDQRFDEVGTVRNPPLCIGLVDGVPALWLRTSAPPAAAYVVFSPSIARPQQTVDTRRPHDAGRGEYGDRRRHRRQAEELHRYGIDGPHRLARDANGDTAGASPRPLRGGCAALTARVLRNAEVACGAVPEHRLRRRTSRERRASLPARTTTAPPGSRPFDATAG